MELKPSLGPRRIHCGIDAGELTLVAQMCVFPNKFPAWVGEFPNCSKGVKAETGPPLDLLWGGALLAITEVPMDRQFPVCEV